MSSSFSRYCAAALAAVFISGSALAQETEVPQTAGTALYSLDYIETGHPENEGPLAFSAMRVFYENALKGGKLSSDLYSRYTALSPEATEVSTGDLIDLAKIYQCSYVPDAPGKIINDHYQLHYKQFRFFGNDSDTSNRVKVFFTFPISYDTHETDSSITDPKIGVITVGMAHLMHPQGKSWVAQATGDSVGFNSALEVLDNLKISDISTAPPPWTNGKAYYTNVQKLTVHSVDDPSKCIQNPDTGEWEVIFDATSHAFDTRDYWSDNSYDPDTTSDPEAPDRLYTDDRWKWRDHNGNGIYNIEDPEYNADGDDDGDGIPNKYDENYDTSPPPANDIDNDGIPDDRDDDRDGDGIPNDQDSTPDVPDTDPNDPNAGGTPPTDDISFTIGDICIDDPNSEECLDLSANDIDTKWKDLLQEFGALFNGFVEFSSIPATAACPSFDVPTGFGSDISIDIDCDMLDMVGMFLLLLATWGAIRIIVY